MLQISISDISKNPSIIDKLDDIAEILNKKTKQVKGVFIPNEYLKEYDNILKEIEYRQFKKRNASLIQVDFDDEALQDGIEND